MKKGILIGLLITVSSFLNSNSQDVKSLVLDANGSLQNVMKSESEMKVTDLVKLVKYAQGAILFESFLSYLRFIKAPERKVFLSQIAELIGHFRIDDSVAEVAIEQSGLSNSSVACKLLKGGINDARVREIAELPEAELEPSFKLLLTLFSIGYQQGYQMNRNDESKFWYWDFSDVKNVFRLVDLGERQYVRLEEVLRP